MLALWFASSGRLADTAVTGAAALAQRQQSAPAPAASTPAPTPTATPASWFAPDDSDEPPAISAPDNRATEPDA